MSHGGLALLLRLNQTWHDGISAEDLGTPSPVSKQKRADTRRAGQTAAACQQILGLRQNTETPMTNIAMARRQVEGAATLEVLLAAAYAAFEKTMSAILELPRRPRKRVRVRGCRGR
jgi:hypothetical protein